MIMTSLESDKKGLLTAKECAKYLGISYSYFYKLKGMYPDLPTYNFGDTTRSYYVGQEVLDFLLAQGRAVNGRVSNVSNK